MSSPIASCKKTINLGSQGLRVIYSGLMLVGSSCAISSHQAPCVVHRNSPSTCFLDSPNTNGVWEILGKRTAMGHETTLGTLQRRKRCGPPDPLLRSPPWRPKCLRPPPAAARVGCCLPLQLRPSLEIARGWRELLCPNPHPCSGQPQGRQIPPANLLPHWGLTLEGPACAGAPVGWPWCGHRCCIIVLPRPTDVAPEHAPYTSSY